MLDDDDEEEFDGFDRLDQLSKREKILLVKNTNYILDKLVALMINVFFIYPLFFGLIMFAFIYFGKLSTDNNYLPYAFCFAQFAWVGIEIIKICGEQLSLNFKRLKD